MAEGTEVDSAEDDAALLERACAGDRQAFGQLYDRHVRGVYWQVYGILRDAQAAEDVTQDVFVTTWSKLHSIHVVDESVLPWLLVTARYTALNARRRAAVRDTAPLDDTQAGSDSVEDEVTAGVVQAEIDKAVAALSDTDRRLYELCVADDHTYQQAAAVLGVSHAAVRNRLSRLRSRLRADLRSIREIA